MPSGHVLSMVPHTSWTPRKALNPLAAGDQAGLSSSRPPNTPCSLSQPVTSQSPASPSTLPHMTVPWGLPSLLGLCLSSPFCGSVLSDTCPHLPPTCPLLSPLPSCLLSTDFPGLQRGTVLPRWRLRERCNSRLHEPAPHACPLSTQLACVTAAWHGGGLDPGVPFPEHPLPTPKWGPVRMDGALAWRMLGGSAFSKPLESGLPAPLMPIGASEGTEVLVLDSGDGSTCNQVGTPISTKQRLT